MPPKKSPHKASKKPSVGKGNPPNKKKHKTARANVGVAKGKPVKKRGVTSPAPIAPPKPPDNSRLEWCPEPCQEDWTTAKVHFWATVCGRYRAYRVNSTVRDTVEYAAQYYNGASWEACAHDPKLGSGYPRYVKSLEAALLCAEECHLKRTGVPTVASNRETIMAKAISLGLATSRPCVANAAPRPREAKPVQTPRSGGAMRIIDAAIKVLEEEGRAMTAKELVDIAEKKGYWQPGRGLTPWASLGAAIYVEIKSGQSRFVLAGKGLFALA